MNDQPAPKSPQIVTEPVVLKTPAPPRPWTCGRLRGNRADVLAKINASGLSIAQKAVITEEISVIPAEHDLIQVDFHRHDYKAGANWCCTVSEL
jgi:hypothetical protein